MSKRYKFFIPLLKNTKSIYNYFDKRDICLVGTKTTINERRS